MAGWDTEVDTASPEPIRGLAAPFSHALFFLSDEEPFSTYISSEEAEGGREGGKEGAVIRAWSGAQGAGMRRSRVRLSPAAPPAPALQVCGR